MHSDEPVLTTLHRSMNRPNQLMGCDRGLFIYLSVVVATLIFSVGTRGSAVTGIVVWVAGLAALRSIAKADPFMLPVFIRHARQNKFYPARSCYQKVGRTTPKNWL